MWREYAVNFITDGIKVKACVRSVHYIWHYIEPQFCSVSLFQVHVYAKRGSRVVNGEAWSQEFSEVNQMPFWGASLLFPTFFNGSTWVPWSTCLLSQECWSWSVEPKGVLRKCKYDKRIIQPGPESSQDTSPTCRHKELWCFSREQAGILNSLLACDDDGLTQPALACGGQLKTTPRS